MTSKETAVAKASSEKTNATSPEEKKVDNMKIASLQELFSNAEPYDWLLMALGTAGGLATGVSLPIFNVIFGQLLDKLNESGSNFTDSINRLCLIFVYIAIGGLIAGFFQVWAWSTTGERQTQKFRMRYVRAILSQEVGWFDACGASELSTNVAELTGKIQDGLGRKMGDMCQYLAQVIAALGVAFYLSWKLTLVLLCAVPFIGAAGFFLITATTEAMHKSLEQYASAGGLATESLSAVRTVTALNMQPGIITKYRKYLFEALRVGTLKGLKVGLGNGGVFCACFLTYALGFWYGGNLVANDLRDGCTHDCVTGGEIMAAFFSTIMGSIALGQVAPPLTSFAAARAAVASILDVVNRKPLIDGLSDEGTKPEGRVSGEVILRDVNFAYPTRTDVVVCKDYQLTIRPGETVALVGPSGCGKSTIINLLLRFYDPQSGVITLDGHNIKELNIKWLRSQIGYVGQEPILFAGTIADNIAYGLSPESKAGGSSRKDSVGGSAGPSNRSEIMSKVIAAAKLANAHDFISEFPNGYDTDVGSNGVAMSGGQKQRIAIARALIKKPAVLLLDEATSALDATSEKIVQQSIDVLAQSKAQTTIIIAHRLSTIRNADKICAIRDGRIAEMGTHDELIAKNGIYADLIRLQLQSGDEEAENENNTSQLIPVDKAVDIKDSAIERARTESADQAGRRYSKVSVNSDHDVEQGADKEEKGKESKEVEISAEQSKSVVRRIRGLILQHPTLLVTGLFGAMIFGAVFPCWGLMLAQTQNMFYLSDPVEMKEKASLYSCYYLLIAGCALFSSIGQYYGVVAVGERVSSTLRSQMFEALMRRNIGFFDLEENAVGTLTTRLADDSRTINKAFGEGLAKQIQAAFTLLIGLGLGFSAAWKIAFVVLACFPLSIIASAIQMQAIAGQQYDSTNDDESGAAAAAKAKADKKGSTGKEVAVVKGKEGGTKTNAAGNTTMSGGHGAVISTAFTHMRTVSAFSMHHSIAKHYEIITTHIAEKRAERSIVAGLGFGGSNTVLFLTYALLFWYGAQLIEDGEIEFVDLMTAILTLMLGALGLGQALADGGDQKAGIRIADRIFRDIDEGNNSPIDGLSVKGVVPAPRATGRIELKNVNFRYPARPDVSVCKGYSLTIETGETVALVGPSGSGKSTIINLLLRFYDPDSGDILLDGVNIKDLNVRWLRSQIGYVGQEPVLFDGHIASNVMRGRSENIEEAILPLDVAMKEAEAEYAATHPNKLLACLGINQPQARTIIPQEEKKGDIEDREVELVSNSLVNVPDDVIEACKASNAHDFIVTFPKGYETEIGEGSIMVSGGQKQRIAIARALIKKPSILLLDEATSALDAASERIVQQSIDALAESKAQTTIIIAHRLSTIRNADKIVVVDKGNIVEIGKHEELLANPKSLYKQLWEKQNGSTA
eukprot:gene2792-2974_t